MIKNFIVKLLATGFGLGLLPYSPGTFGTLLGIPIFYFLEPKGPFAYMLITITVTVVGCIVAEIANHLFKEVDCQKIVIDEVAGYMVTMVWLPRTWQAIAAGFILFRIFDITKPGPIRYLERKIKGGIGVVADDILAGIFANIILQIIYTHTTWLGSQLT